MTRIRARLLAVTGAALVAVACGSGGSSGPSQTAAGPAALVTKQAGDGQSATVGKSVAVAPAVKVTDASGRGVAGVAVRYSGSTGDVLGAAAAATGSDGIASVGSWTLGTGAGPHVLNATVTGLAPASFSATATADVAKAMAKLAGDGQTAGTGTNVAVAPSVTVSDAYGNPVGGVNVAFAVSAGGGTVGSPAATTNSGGSASAGSWRLGNSLGANALVASSTGLPSLTFTATGALDPCTLYVPVAVGATTSGTLAASDCLVDGKYYTDLYSFVVGAGQAIQLDMASTAFDPWLDLGSTNPDDYFGFDNNSGGGTSARLRMLAPPGTYVGMANSLTELKTGDYTFGASTWSGDLTGCENDGWIVPGGSTYTLSITTGDCPTSGNGTTSYADGVNFVAYAGVTYTLTMASTAVDPVMRLYDAITGALVRTDDNGGGGTTAKITWTPTTSTYAVLFMATAAPAMTGAYTISITKSATAAVLTSLPPATVRAVHRPASAGAGAPWVFPPMRERTTAPAAHRP